MNEIYSVPQLLEEAVNKMPNREALYDRQRRLTYKELDEETDQLAAALAVFGIQKGDHIGVCLPNWHETVIIFFAAAKIGATIIPFNPKYRKHEFQYIIGDSRPKLLFICEEASNQVDLAELEMAPANIVTVRYEREGFSTFQHFFKLGENRKKPDVTIDPRNDNFCILYTSGTTGLPKGAISTHENATGGSVQVAKGLKCTPDDVYLITVPIFHVLGLGSCLLSAISTQSKIVLLDKYSPVTAFQLIEAEKVTVRHGVPAMFIIELNHPDLTKYDLSSLRVGLSGGAPIHPETLYGVREKMKMEICGGFGLTEVFSITTTMLPDEDKNIIETLGKVMPGAGLKIVDENRKELPYGEVGEIVVKGFGIAKGYLNKPELTKEAYDEDGWFYTGDLGTLDEKGYLRFKGRKKELIIRGGYNIFPQEVEQLLHEHPNILQAAVIGLPDKVMGEEVCAVVKMKSPEMSITSKEVEQFLEDKIAKYKIPTKVLVVDEFPVTASGKIQKVKLREAIVNDNVMFN